MDTNQQANDRPRRALPPRAAMAVPRSRSATPAWPYLANRGNYLAIGRTSAERRLRIAPGAQTRARATRSGAGNRMLALPAAGAAQRLAGTARDQIAAERRALRAAR